MRTGANTQLSQKSTWDGVQELHNALKASKEIGRSMSLHQFIMDLQDNLRTEDVQYIYDTPDFCKFLQSVIVCTEAKYNENALKQVLKKPKECRKGGSYLNMLSSLVVELLKEQKIHHL